MIFRTEGLVAILMNPGGQYVSLSRDRLGPEPAPDDVLHVSQDLIAVSGMRVKWVGACSCGWRSGRRFKKVLAREALAAHIAARS